MLIRPNAINPQQGTPRNGMTLLFIAQHCLSTKKPGLICSGRAFCRRWRDTATSTAADSENSSDKAEIAG